MRACVFAAASVFMMAVGALMGTGCGPAGEGAPCNIAADCASPLICDVHDGQGHCEHEHDDEDGGTEDAGT